jgi:hypothetical protein
MGAGIDTLNLNMAGTAMLMTSSNTPTLGGVEIINFAALTGTNSFVASLAPVLTTLNVAYGSGTTAYTVTAASAALTTLGFGASTGNDSDVTLTYATSGSSSATDTVTLNLGGVNASGVANEAVYAFNGAAAGTDQGIENFVINTTGTNSLETFTSLEVAAGASALKSVTASGTGTFSVINALVFDSTNLGTINLTGNTGATDLGVGNITLTYTGGSGSDILRFGTAGTFSSADTVSFGTGTADTLFLADTSIGQVGDTTLNAAINAITSLDVLGISGAATVDMSRLTVNALSLGAGANTVLVNMEAADSAQVNAVTTGTINATATLGFNTINLALNQNSDAVAATGTLNVTGNSTINISSNSTGTAATANTIGAVTNSAGANFVLTGSQALTITSFSGVATAVNGSAMTGILTATGGNAASALTGGSKADVLTGATVAGGDTLVGGAGNDTLNTAAITGTTVTSISGGLGADAINLLKVGVHTGALVTLRATAAESFATASQFDTVTFADAAQLSTNIVTLVTGQLSSTIVGIAQSALAIGSTAVVAGSYLAAGSTNGTLTASSQNFQIYQDSNSNGIIDSTDLRVDFTKTLLDTLTIDLVGGQVVVTATGP